MSLSTGSRSVLISAYIFVKEGEWSIKPTIVLRMYRVVRL
jgi:hypothetical protein